MCEMRSKSSSPKLFALCSGCCPLTLVWFQNESQHDPWIILSCMTSSATLDLPMSSPLLVCCCSAARACAFKHRQRGEVATKNGVCGESRVDLRPTRPLFFVCIGTILSSRPMVNDMLIIVEMDLHELHLLCQQNCVGQCCRWWCVWCGCSNNGKCSRKANVAHHGPSQHGDGCWWQMMNVVCRAEQTPLLLKRNQFPGVTHCGPRTELVH